MDINADDFPLYKLLVDLDQPGVERMKADFAQAKLGGDEEQYRFAMGIQTVAVLDEGVVPGMTKEVKEKTLQSCLAVFNEVASHGHEGGAYMVKDYAARGLGQPAQPKRAKLKGRFHL